MAPQGKETEPRESIPRGMLTPLTDTTAKLPDDLQGLFTLTGWAESLVNGVKYEEPDPNYLSRMLIEQTLTAKSPEEVLQPNDIDGLQKIIPNTPGAGTGPVEINELYVASSDKDMGTPCYMIFGFVDMETGAFRRTTTGATQLQAQILRLLGFGIWPIRGNIKRTERKDKGGRFLFWLFPPD